MKAAVFAACMVAVGSAAAYGPVAISPTNVPTGVDNLRGITCAGSNVVVLFRGFPGSLGKAVPYVAVSSNGSWYVRPLISLPTASTRGQIGLSARIGGGHGKAFVAYHDWIGTDNLNIVEVRGHSIIPIVSIPRREVVVHDAFPYPRSMAYDGQYLWVSDDGLLARVHKTQIHTITSGYCKEPVDMVVPRGKPVRWGDNMRVIRLVGKPSEWQNKDAWKTLQAPRLEDCSCHGWTLQSNGARVWGVRVTRSDSQFQLVVATAPVTGTSFGPWRVLRKTLSKNLYTDPVAFLVRTPSGNPKLIAFLRRRTAKRDTYTVNVVSYDLKPSGIGPVHLIGKWTFHWQSPYGLGFEARAAVDDQGHIYVAWGANYKIWLATDNPRWKPGPVTVGQPPTGNLNVGAGRPDFVIEPSGLANWNGRIYNRGGYIWKDLCVVRNRGATYRRPLTVLYQLAGIKLYATATPVGGTHPPCTIFANHSVRVYPKLRLYLHQRKRGNPLKPSFTYKDPQTGKIVTTSTPPVIIAPSQPVGRHHPRETVRVDATLPLGRYTLRIVVDPRKQVQETDESNNVYTRDVVVYDGIWGYYDKNHKYHRYYNDLALFPHVRMWPNETLHMPGFVRGKVTVNAWVLNEHKADWFDHVVVRALLDGKRVWQGSVGPLTREGNLPRAEFFPRASRDEKISAALVTIPLDFSNVSLGQHTLRIVLDPENRTGDNYRANNAWSDKILIRKRGGTVIVTAKDRGTGAAIAGASIIIRRQLGGGRGKLIICSARTDANGRAVIKDVPPGQYPAGLVRAFKRSGEVKYAYTEAPAFTVHAEQTTRITIRMERPVTLTGTVRDSSTNQPVKYGAVWLDNDLRSWLNNGTYKFEFVEPGSHTVKVRGFGYKTAQETLQVHGDAQARMTHNFTLQRLPRGTLVVQCRDDKNKAVKGAYVDVRNTPLGGSSGNNGNVTISDVPANRKYKIFVTEDTHATAVATTPKITANSTTTVKVTMPAIQRKRARVKCRVVTWADLESYPGFSIGSGSSSSWKVKAEFGVFKTDLVLHYHTPRGSSSGYVFLDDLFVSFYPGEFYNSTVSSTYDPSDLISGIVGKIFKPAGEALEKVGTLISVADIPNSIYDALTGEQANLKQINNGTLYGTHTTHTGAEEESASFYSLPDTSVELGVTVAGDKTAVLLRTARITDGETNMVIKPWWHSPGMMHWTLGGKKMKWDDVVVKLNVDVLNSNGSSSVLGLRSRNIMTWRPSKKNDLTMEPTGWGG